MDTAFDASRLDQAAFYQIAKVGEIELFAVAYGSDHKPFAIAFKSDGLFNLLKDSGITVTDALRADLKLEATQRSIKVAAVETMDPTIIKAVWDAFVDNPRQHHEIKYEKIVWAKVDRSTAFGSTR